jgi:hypothetical protein
MINVTTDRLLTLTEAANICPKVNGKRRSTVSMWRWTMKGVAGVRLEHARIGRCVFTTEEALNRFCRDVASAQVEQGASKSSAPAGARASQPQKSAVKQRERQISQARARMIARGMLQEETGH